MTFLVSYVTTKIREARDELYKAVTRFDPESASEAQLLQYKNQVDELAKLAADGAAKSRDSNAQLAALEAKFNQYKAAALKVSEKISDPLTSPETVKTQESVLNDLLTEAENLKTAVEDARVIANDNASYHNELVAMHSEAVTKWTTGRQRLEKAKADMQRAERDERRQAEIKANRERALGLRSGLDTSDVALSAMEEIAREKKIKADASRLTVDALGSVTDKNKGVAEALAAVSNKPVTKTAAERLASL